MRKCSKCSRKLPTEAFTKDRTTSDGLSRWCRECKSAYHKEYYKNHATDLKQYQKDVRTTQPKVVAERAHQTYQKRKEAALNYSKQHRQQHVERYRHLAQQSRARDRVRSNTQALKAWHKRRATFKAADDGTVTKEALGLLYRTWSGVCPICGRTAPPTLDHIIPLAKGGLHSICNLQLMCGRCNSAKGAK